MFKTATICEVLSSFCHPSVCRPGDLTDAETGLVSTQITDNFELTQLVNQ